MNYNKYNDNNVYLIKKIKNGNIIVNIDNFLYILKINENNNFELIQEIKNINNVKELKSGNLITISENKKIIIWKLENEKFNKINEINNEEEGIKYDLIEVKDNIIYYDCQNNMIVCYDLNENKKIKTFDNIEIDNNFNINKFCYDSKYIFYSGKSKIYIFKDEEKINEIIINQNNLKFFSFYLYDKYINFGISNEESFIYCYEDNKFIKKFVLSFRGNFNCLNIRLIREEKTIKFFLNFASCFGIILFKGSKEILIPKKKKKKERRN